MFRVGGFMLFRADAVIRVGFFYFAKRGRMAKCNVCGKALNKDNSIGKSMTCLDCQADRFRYLESDNGCHIALFLACGMFDLPLIPELAPEDLSDETENHLLIYCKRLIESGEIEENGNIKGFANGVHDLRKIFGKTLSQNDFAKFIEFEQKRAEKVVGTPEQRRKWGIGNLSEGLPFTTELYEELDGKYAVWVERYRGQTITSALDESIIKICKWNAIADYLLSIGNYADAQKVQAMVQKEMESEQMRKKDEKPVEALRIDALILALEEAGFMENGLLLTYDELIEAMRDTHIKSQKYDYSLDTADQVLMDMYNSMRANADMEMVSSLPYEMKTEDWYGEFLPEETEREKAAKKYAGLTKVSFDPPKRKKKE